MRKTILFIFSFLFIITAAACSSSGSGDSSTTDDVEGSGSETISASPSLRIELNSQAVDASISQMGLSKSEASAVGEQTVGGCLAWAVRKNVKLHSSIAQHMQCLYKAAVDAGVIVLDEDETLYLNMGTPENSVSTRITDTGGVVQISLCHDDSAEENVRITAQESGDGYIISGTAIVDEGAGENSDTYTSVTLDTSVAGVEDYSFIDHIVNETDAALCSGASGTSLTEDDDTCFLRYEGTLTNNTANADSPFSVLSGIFSEKNSGGTRTAASTYTKFMGGSGASRFSAGLGDVNDDVNADPAIDSWLPLDFVAIDPVSFVSDISSQALPSRTATLPSIDDPWDCQMGEEISTIDYSGYSSFVSELDCEIEMLEGADMTNCTGGDVELAEVIEGYLCDANDPLIDVSTQCP